LSLSTLNTFGLCKHPLNSKTFATKLISDRATRSQSYDFRIYICVQRQCCIRLDHL
jgi:hypothetical protein